MDADTELRDCRARLQAAEEKLVTIQSLLDNERAIHGQTRKLHIEAIERANKAEGASVPNSPVSGDRLKERAHNAWVAAFYASNNNIAESYILAALEQTEREALERPPVALPLEEYHEDYGEVLWWIFPIQEGPYIGSPLDTNWPGYHTHWTAIRCPTSPSIISDQQSIGTQGDDNGAG